jgi:hypothetical protein
MEEEIAWEVSSKNTLFSSGETTLPTEAVLTPVTKVLAHVMSGVMR